MLISTYSFHINPKKAAVMYKYFWGLYERMYRASSSNASTPTHHSITIVFSVPGIR